MTPKISSNVVLDPRVLREKVKHFLDQPRLVYDIETMPPDENSPSDYRGEHPVNRTAWMSFATFGETFVLPIGHPNGNRLLEKSRRRKDPVTKKFIVSPPRYDAPPTQIRPAEAFEILHPLFFDPNIRKGGHGVIFDFLSIFKYYGERAVGPFDDTIIQAWLLNENQRLGLKDITLRRYKREYDKEQVGRKVELHPFNKVAHYAYMDAKFTWLNQERNLPMLEEQGLTKVYDLEMSVFDTLLDMEVEGMPVDEAAMRELEPILSRHREQCEGKVYKAAGKKLNLNSPKQKVDVLYGKKSEGNQGLKPWRLTKGGITKQKKGLDLTLYDYSTDGEALERFKGNKVVDAILDYQEVDRVLGTYIHGYLGVPGDPKKPCAIFDGKVYPDFVQYGTVTGRFSCRAPNLQNIPRPDTPLGKQIRSLFIAGPGHKLIVSDYGQIELVVLAHFVGKGALFEGFFQGIDPHTMTAALVFNQDPHELQKRVDNGDDEAKGWRQAAKAINFAVVYGAGPDKVASMAKVSVRRAKEILEIHEEQFPEIYKFKDQALATMRSRKPPYLSTLVGRKRRIPAIMSGEWGTRGRAERQAINSLIQGSAADLIKVAMVDLNRMLAESGTGAKLLLTVHDELVVRVKEECAERAAEVVREAMVGPGVQGMVDVPLSIDLKIVDKWAEAK